MSSQLDIVSQIKSYWSEKATGALFSRLSNGHLLQLFFVKGELQSAKYQGVSGIDVLKQIPGLIAVKSQFHEGAISRVVNQLPATADIINMISDSSFNIAQQPTARISSSDLSVIEGIFVDYIGPIAGLIFSEEVQNVDSVDDLVNRLSQEIGDVDKREQFKRQVASAIKA